MSGCSLQKSCGLRRVALTLGVLAVAALTLYASGVGRRGHQARAVASREIHHAAPTPESPDGQPGDLHVVQKPALSAEKQPELMAAVSPSLATKEIQAAAASATHSTLDDASKKALLLNIDLLAKGYETFKKVPHYTATFNRQERIAGFLNEPEEMEVKVRHQPFSVYMHWQSMDPGREVLYVDGEHNNKMMIRLGGLKGRLLPPLSLDPNGSEAMKRTRFPITQAGILGVSEILLRDRRKDLAENVPLRCDFVEKQIVNNRECYYFCFEFLDPAISETYRKSVQFIDRELMLPIWVQNFTWPDESDTASKEEGLSLDDSTLIGYYSYSNLNTGLTLGDADFDRANPDYRFR